MIFIDNGFVVLPAREEPWILDGREQPRVVQHVFVTPEGYFPRLIDLTNIFGRSKRELAYQKIKSTNDRWKDYYKILEPTVEDVEKALENVNRLYTWVNEKKDNCPLCNDIDDGFFEEKCWVFSIDHNCGEPDKRQEYKDIIIKYYYKGDYQRTTLADWFNEISPHHLMEKNK